MNNNEFEKCEFYQFTNRKQALCILIVYQNNQKIGCKSNPDCLFKQNLKLQEENKGLKEQIEELANCILAENKGVPLNEGACIYTPEKNNYNFWGDGKTKGEALLKLCIQLKDEIKEEVQKIFKELK